MTSDDVHDKRCVCRQRVQGGGHLDLLVGSGRAELRVYPRGASRATLVQRFPSAEDAFLTMLQWLGQSDRLAATG